MLKWTFSILALVASLTAYGHDTNHTQLRETIKNGDQSIRDAYTLADAFLKLRIGKVEDRVTATEAYGPRIDLLEGLRKPLERSVEDLYDRVGILENTPPVPDLTSRVEALEAAQTAPTWQRVDGRAQILLDKNAATGELIETATPNVTVVGRGEHYIQFQYTTECPAGAYVTQWNVNAEASIPRAGAGFRYYANPKVAFTDGANGKPTTLIATVNFYNPNGITEGYRQEIESDATLYCSL